MYLKPSGMPYYRFLRMLHEACLFDWYLEVGCRSGESFAPVRSKTIAVDPFFRADINIIGKKPALHVFQATSDDFFASGFLARNGIRLGLAFLDGMHLFEFLLRDFMNTEAAMDPKGVIMLHDCVPYGAGMTTRDLARLPKGSWTGDVWKLIPILQHWRPDLRLTVLDCRSTGLVCVSGLNPESRVLVDSYERIVTDWVGVELAEYGTERFFGSFQMVSARTERHTGFPLFRQAAVEGMGLEPVPVTP
ncbi:MAG: hypothetical protein FD150_1143 [Rhodobacteraceae bacterium]|nr:MAG: hypothetical protein FD150_1143 [Paracoccaceae bacterium]